MRPRIALYMQTALTVLAVSCLIDYSVSRSGHPTGPAETMLRLIPTTSRLFLLWLLVESIAQWSRQPAWKWAVALVLGLILAAISTFAIDEILTRY